MDGRQTWTDRDEAGDYVVPNVLSPRDLVSRPDVMDETVPHTQISCPVTQRFCFRYKDTTISENFKALAIFCGGLCRTPRTGFLTSRLKLSTDLQQLHSSRITTKAVLGDSDQVLH